MLPFRKYKEVVCTICSGQKREDPGLLPACERYLAPRIKLVSAIARRRPFFILSGMMGLILADTGIPHYDHKLGQDGVEPLAERIARQVVHHKISVIFYYHEPKADWAPYTQALRKGVLRANGALVYMPLLVPGPAPQEDLHGADAPVLA